MENCQCLADLWWFTYQKWWFSIATLNNQRVSIYIYICMYIYIDNLLLYHNLSNIPCHLLGGFNPIYPNISPLYPHKTICFYIQMYYHDHITHITTLKNSALWFAGTSRSNSSMIFPTELPWLGHVDFFFVLCSIATLFLTEGLLLLLLLFVCLTTDVANDLMMPQLFQGRD